MNPSGSRGNCHNSRPLLPAQVQGDDGGGMWCSNNWVWSLPRILNSTQLIRDEGMCACDVSQIQSQQQKQQPQHIPHINNVPHQPVYSLFGHSSGPLRFLFCKELTKSDIRKKNKIILQRREVETHFPHVESRQGILFYMDDDTTQNTLCFKLRYRITTNSKIYSLEGTRNFLQFHELKEGDCIVFYKDVETANYVIGVSKQPRAVSDGGSSSVTTRGSLDSNLDTITDSSGYAYFNQLSDYGIVDEMEEVATLGTPYLYGDATWTGGDLVSCDLERLDPLHTFEFANFPFDHMF